MPSYGFTDVSTWGTGYGEFENRAAGILITPTSSGAITSISVYMYESIATGNHGVVPVVYSSGGSKIDQGTCRNNIPTAQGWVTFTGLTATLNSGTTYFIGTVASPGGGDLRVRSRAGSTSRRDSAASPVPTAACGAYTAPSSITLASLSLDYGVYVTIGAAPAVAVTPAIKYCTSTKASAIVSVETLEPNFFLQDRLYRTFTL